MEWIKVESKKRKKIKKQNPTFFNRVTEILLKHDLMRINYKVNPDEYEPEAGTIIQRLPECSNYLDARQIIHEEFIRWFYDNVGSESEYTDVAKEIWETWINFGMKNKI